IQGRWDRLRIEQVLMNLISNAIKYAARRPVHVPLVRERDTAVIEVRARGPGIPEDAIGRIFERFERAVSARNYGGMGLGLYVARPIAEAHRGALTARPLSASGA